MVFRFLFCFLFAFHFAAVSADAKRVALVIGQNAYTGLATLPNPRNDARRMAALLAGHGFDVISCDGQTPGCFDQTRAGLLKALNKLELAADGADLALVFYAGHGMETEFGNVLAPVDATVDCKTWQVSRGVLIEQFVVAASPARHKVIILDACRDNPMGLICPPLKDNAPVSFKDIKLPDARDFLLVTSTKPGQQAQDGPPGKHSPFATALFAALEASPEIYFDQVFNRVAKATIEATKASGFTQLPETLARGGAPEACLRGTGCAGDIRAAALAAEVGKLREARRRDQELSGTAQAYLGEIEKQRGRRLTPEERARALAELQAMSRDLAARNDARGERALARLRAGDKTAAEKLFEEDLAAQEAAERAAEKRRADRRRKMASSARHLAALNRYSDVAKAVEFYQKAVRYDPSDTQTWDDLARAAADAGDTTEAARAFKEAARLARDGDDPKRRFWANTGLGDIALAQGRLPSARRFYETAGAIGERLAASDPNNAGWQRDLTVSYNKVGDVQVAQGDLKQALASYRSGLAIGERLAASDPNNAGWQRDVWVSYWRLARFEPQTYWPKVIARLEDMERRGILNPVDRKWIAKARAEYAKVQ